MATDAIIRTSASQTTASIHSGSNSHVLTLAELNDLALRGPEPGQINYFFLHQVIDTLIKELGLQEHPSAVLESYVSVDDAYLVPQNNSNIFNAHQHSRGTPEKRRSSARDLHASRSQIERPKAAATAAEKATLKSTIAVASAKSAPSIQQTSTSHNAPTTGGAATKTAGSKKHDSSGADGKHTKNVELLADPHGADDHFQPSPPSPAFTDASFASSAAGSRKTSPKEKIGIVVVQQPRATAAKPTEKLKLDAPTNHTTKSSESPLHRALSRSNVPSHMGTPAAAGRLAEDASGAPSPLGRKDSGTSTNTTTIKVYNAVPMKSSHSADVGKKNSLLLDSRADGGHVRARLERLERFMHQLLAKGGAVSADEMQKLMSQLESLSDDASKKPKQTLMDGEMFEKILQRLADAEKRMSGITRNVGDLQNTSEKFKHFLGDDGDENKAPLSGVELQRAAEQAKSDTQLNSSRITHVESKVDHGFAHAQAERAAIAAKAEAVAADLRKSKLDSITNDDIEQRIRAHMAGIVSWTELDDALQEMRDSFARMSLGGTAAPQPSPPATTTTSSLTKLNTTLASAKAAAAVKKQQQQDASESDQDPIFSSSDAPQTGKLKRYVQIKEDGKTSPTAAERAAKRDEVNARAAAWSTARASRSPVIAESAGSSSDAENVSPSSLSPPSSNNPNNLTLARSKENVFRQLEQLSRTGKTIPTLLDEFQERLDKAATQAQVNSIIDEIASDLALQNQRIEHLANQFRHLEERLLQLAPHIGVSTVPTSRDSPPQAAAAESHAESSSDARRQADAKQRERDRAKMLLENDLRRASAELLKKRSKENTSSSSPGGMQLSDEWLKLQEARIQNLLDRIDSLRAEWDGDRSELFLSLNVMGEHLKDCQRNCTKLAKQLQEQMSAGTGPTPGRGKRGGQNPFAEDELDDLINDCQNDIETLKVVAKELALKDGQLDKTIESIMELIERLQETKADKAIINTLLSTKADKKALETKVSRSTFEMLETKWQGVMEVTGDKIEAIEKDVRIQKNRRAHDYAAFATRKEVQPLHDAINIDMRIIKEQLEKVIRVLELEEAAAVRKSWMRCIACDRKCDMADHAHHPSVPYLPPMPLMAAASVEAYTAQHLAAAAAAEAAASGEAMTTLHSGGAGAAQNATFCQQSSKSESGGRVLTRYEQLLLRRDLTRNLMQQEVAYKNIYNATQHKRDQHYSQERPVGGFHTLAAPKSAKPFSARSEQQLSLDQ